MDIDRCSEAAVSLLNPMPKIKIYSGLTLDRATIAKHLPDADVGNPIQRGDIWRDIKNRTHVVLIIDGKFHHNLPVSINEIMDGLRCGIAIYGSSSMGALRAAELYPYGMVGHGKIFEFIKNDRYFRDDYLGQTFIEDKGVPREFSQSYIDLYFNMEALLLAHKISRVTFDAVTSLYRDLPYPSRNFATLKRSIDKQDDEMKWASEAISQRMGSQKRADALSLLKFVKAELKRIESLNRKLHRGDLE